MLQVLKRLQQDCNIRMIRKKISTLRQARVFTLRQIPSNQGLPQFGVEQERKFGRQKLSIISEFARLCRFGFRYVRYTYAGLSQ